MRNDSTDKAARLLCLLRPVDLLTFCFLFFLTALTIIFFSRIPRPTLLIFIYVSLIAALFSLIYFKNKHNGKVLKTIYDIIFPVIAVMLIFDSLGGLVHYINPKDYDHHLIRIDYIIFGNHPTVVFERFVSPFLTEIFQLAYSSYYFLPIILGIVLKVRGEEKAFDRTLFLIILCFYLSYIGYILVPAIGPRYTMEHLHEIELKGVLIRDVIDRTLNALEGIKRDAFPSGHTAVALVVLYLAYKYHKKLFYLYLPVILALLVSTVYLRYHYAVDVLGGIVLSVFTIYLGEWYYNYWEIKNGNTPGRR
ncbi:MAG: phosphatase PAP2 family protein [Nitrospirae bacterium]|nr:phosphatase PAP2 family protein [Nitrospirota bacterium]